MARDTRREVYVPDSLWKRVKMRAAYEGTSASELVRRGLRQVLATPADDKEAELAQSVIPAGGVG